MDKTLFKWRNNHKTENSVQQSTYICILSCILLSNTKCKIFLIATIDFINYIPAPFAVDFTIQEDDIMDIIAMPLVYLPRL